MAKQFEFKKGLQLDIAGNVFEVDTTDPDVMRNVLEFADGAKDMAEGLKDIDNYVEQLEDTIKLCLTAMDAILGDGASEKIFEGRKVGLMDCLDVMNYIIAEIKEDRGERLKMYSPNRAQRRSKK